MTAMSSKVVRDDPVVVASVRCCRSTILRAVGPVQPILDELRLREVPTKRPIARDAARKVAAKSLCRMTAIVAWKPHAANRQSRRMLAALTAQGANRDGAKGAGPNVANDRRGHVPTKLTRVPWRDPKGVEAKAFVGTTTSSILRTMSKVLAADCWPILNRQQAKVTNHAHVGAVVAVVAEAERHAKSVQKSKAAQN